MIKDSWEIEERPVEGLLLKEATEAGINNVARYYYHENICTGGEMDDVRHNLRKGLSDNGGRNSFQQRFTFPQAITSLSMSRSRTIKRKSVTMRRQGSRTW